MKTLLFISHSSNITGGGEEDFQKLLKYFYGKYHIISIFPRGDKSVNYIKYSEKYLEVKGTVFPYTQFNLKKYLVFFYRNFKKLFIIYSFAKKNKPIDLCYVNSSVCFLETLPLIYLRIPYIISVKEKINPGFVRKFIYLYYKYTALKIITISKFLQNILIKETHVHDIKVIYSTIDEKYYDTVIDKYYLNEKQRDLNKFTILNIGSIYPNKGQHVLIEALATVKDRNIILDYYGKSVDDKYLSNIKKQINKYSLINNVFFKGEILKKELICKILDSDLVVVTSKEEGQSLVILEALYLERPLITTKVGIVTEIIENDKNGMLYDYMDYNRLGELIITLKTNKTLYDYIKSNSRKTYNKYFSSEVSKLIYNKVVEENTSK